MKKINVVLEKKETILIANNFKSLKKSNEIKVTTNYIIEK